MSSECARFIKRQLETGDGLWAAAHTLLFPQLDVDDDSDSATLDAQAPDTSKDAQASSSQFHDEPFTLKITGEAAGQIGALYGCCQYDDSSPSPEQKLGGGFARVTSPTKRENKPSPPQDDDYIRPDFPATGPPPMPVIPSFVPKIPHFHRAAKSKDYKLEAAKREATTEAPQEDEASAAERRRRAQEEQLPFFTHFV